ncbi:MAG: PEP-CTERM sorting domain-containing protein [Bryobacterales bacterium]|nr:PEP-CTERM sorting domain-containing protein [Bryobacterales bacterium]
MRTRNALFLMAFAAQLAYGGLIGFYPVDGNANDFSGNGSNATVVTDVSCVAGFEGLAALFNGSTSYIQIPVNINPGVTPMLTMGAWVLPSDVNPVRGIISHDNGGFDRNLNIDYRGSCAGSACYAAFTGSSVLAGSVATANPADWVFVAASYNASTGAVVLYVDGNVYTANGFPGSGVAFTHIGHNPSYPEWFSGLIDNVFLFDQILSESEIAAIRAGGAEAIMKYAGPGQIPEPGTFVLAGGALLAAVLLRRRLRG